MQIGELLGEEYLKRFKIYYSSTLFEPNWDALKKGRCPLCGNKLKVPLKGKIVYCKGIKHKKPFTMDYNKFRKLLTV